ADRAHTRIGLAKEVRVDLRVIEQIRRIGVSLVCDRIQLNGCFAVGTRHCGIPGVAIEIAYIGRIDHGIEPDVTLDGQIELVAALQVLVAVDGAGGGRGDYRGRSRLGYSRDRAVVQRRRVDHRRSAAARYVVRGAVVEDAAGSADH